ncbi:hypothetical protein FACS1894132_14170 [Clostridia bacterium]|nr:hypothetical protein FACS1894132_14170 [Clostridia bacterium]
MAVSKEDYNFCEDCLSERADFLPVEIQRFLNNANKEQYQSCPYCGGISVYSCERKQIMSNVGLRILDGVLTREMSEFLDDNNKFCWCSTCTSSGSGWF